MFYFLILSVTDWSHSVYNNLNFFTIQIPILLFAFRMVRTILELLFRLYLCMFNTNGLEISNWSGIIGRHTLSNYTYKHI